MNIVVLSTFLAGIITSSSCYYFHDVKHFEEHIPTIGKDGVPLDTPEVQEAKRQHHIAHEEVKAQHAAIRHHEHEHHYDHHGYEHEHDHEHGHLHEIDHGHEYKPIHDYYHHLKKRSLYYDDHHPLHVEEHVPVLTKSGVPEDTPEVQEARQQHLEAVEIAKHRANYEHDHEHDYENHDYHYNSKYDHHLHKRSAYTPQYYKTKEHNPVLTHHGVPENTQEVKEARENHFAYLKNAQKLAEHEDHYHKNNKQHFSTKKLADLQKYNQHVYNTQYSKKYQPRTTHYYNKQSGHRHLHKRSIHDHEFHHEEEHHPVLTRSGVPEDTDEVKQAKEDHFVAIEHAKHLAKEHEKYELEHKHYEHENKYTHPYVPKGYYHHLKKRSVHLFPGAYEEHKPVLNKYGVPEETEEVRQAKEEHFHAIELAKQQELIHESFDKLKDKYGKSSYHDLKKFEHALHHGKIFDYVPKYNKNIVHVGKHEDYYHH